MGLPGKPQMLRLLLASDPEPTISLSRDEFFSWGLQNVNCSEPGCQWHSPVIDSDHAVEVLAEHLNLAHGYSDYASAQES